MKFSEQWLRDFVDPDISTQQLAEQLTMGGLEVDSVAPVAQPFSKVVVGRVVARDKHPQADSLSICQVDIGVNAPLTVVCGAANAKVDLRAPVALVGARLPSDLTVEISAVRGVDSHGMLCSAAELGIGEDAEGLLELPEDAPLGVDLRSYLELDDSCIEVDLTPNRGDCLSVYGIARDVAVFNQKDCDPPAIPPVENACTDKLAVHIQTPESCPHYVGRLIRDIDTNAVTPVWMRERLRRSGLRPIHPVVDITNYVMLELGQPMHAFDLDKLDGGIQVRLATDGESITLLDGQEVRLAADTVVIADQRRAIALAGIMGGADTAVDQHSRHIFLESAFFSPAVMAGKARQYKLATDSSHRFERGVDFELQGVAVERATQLLVEICNARPGQISHCRHDEFLPSRPSIKLRSARIERLLGIHVADTEVTQHLRRLGLEVSTGDGCWSVTPPSYRFDLNIEADLIEEIARVRGYDRIPSHRPLGKLTIQAKPETHLPLARLCNVLIDRGYQEVITYSFVDPTLQEHFDTPADAVALQNPISSEMSVMRTSLLPGLVNAMQYNLNRQQQRVRLFETGLVFRREGRSQSQIAMIGGIAAGPRAPEQWAVDNNKVDFYDLKQDIQGLIDFAGDPPATFEASQRPGLHPGQTALIRRAGAAIGYLGALHPSVLRALGIDERCYVFQLELSALTQTQLPTFSPLPKFPTVRRDLSIVVDKHIIVSSLLEAIYEQAPEALKSLHVFDVYAGKGIDPKEKSVGLGLIFQGISSTLVDEDVDRYMARILAHLMQTFAVRLRD